MAQLLVGGDADRELLLGASPQVAIRQLRSLHLKCSGHFMPAQVVAQRHRRPLIKGNVH
jgi:hypothetical protein